MSVTVVPTPNPDAYMFRVPETLVASGTYEFSAGEDISMSPLAQHLFTLEEVALILITPRFITVRKHPDCDWEPLCDTIVQILESFLQGSEMAIFEAPSQHSVQERTDIEKRILALLDEEIRPAIAQDGGDVVFHGFEEGIVRLELIGACGTCPSSTITLKDGIQRLLIEEIPEVLAVESV